MTRVIPLPPLMNDLGRGIFTLVDLNRVVIGRDFFIMIKYLRSLKNRI